ncbi:MAG: hypothetical protein NVSMB6_11710 [Burkholderiaceae bacterium]
MSALLPCRPLRKLPRYIDRAVPFSDTLQAQQLPIEISSQGEPLARLSLVRDFAGAQALSAPGAGPLGGS